MKYEIVLNAINVHFFQLDDKISSLQSLDYEICDNELYQNDTKFRESQSGYHKDINRWILFILIGKFAIFNGFHVCLFFFFMFHAFLMKSLLFFRYYNSPDCMLHRYCNRSIVNYQI